MRSLLVICALGTCLTVAEASDSKLSFVDLRAQGGVTGSDGTMGAVTLMCGDIGDRDPHVIEIDQDAGIVIGVRGLAGRANAQLTGGSKQSIRLAGGEALGGFGYLSSPKDLFELLAGYHLGVTGATGDAHRFPRNGTYRGGGGELGWYHTWDSHLQFGLVAGYSLRLLKLDVPGGGHASARVAGVDGCASVGYRF